MATAETIRLVQIAGNTRSPMFDKVYLFNGGYNDHSTNAADYTDPADNSFLANAADYLYVGGASAFYKLGFRVGTTAPDIGPATFEYWSGATWSSFTPIVDSTSDFSSTGWLAWSALSGWATTAVNSVTKYWIRISSGAINVAGQYKNLLRQTTVAAPIFPFEPDIRGDGVVRDVNAALNLAATANAGTGSLRATLTRRALNMLDLNLCIDWEYYDLKLFIEDLAQTATPNLTVDSFFKNYTGYLVRIDPRVKAASKMSGLDRYAFDFEIEAVTPVI